MKAKFDALKASISAKLAEAKTALEANDFVKAESLNSEAATMRKQAEVMKSFIAQSTAEDADAKDAKIASLEADAKKPVRLTGLTGEGEGDTDKSAEPDLSEMAYVLRYGEPDKAVKAIINDLYGVDYQAKRALHRDTFVKFVRFGEKRLTAREYDALMPRRLLVTPESIVFDIKSGLTVHEIKTNLEETPNDLGGFLIPEDYHAEINKRLMGITVVRPNALVINTVRDAVDWPELDGGNSQYTSGVRVVWVDETPSSATIAATNPTFAMRKFPINTAMARTDLSKNLLEDSAFNLLDLLAGLFAEALAIDEDARFLTGIGGGMPKGILGERVTGAQFGPVTGITAVVSGNATVLTADGLIDLVYGLDAQYRKKAILVAAKATHGAIRKLKDGVGQYLWEKNVQAFTPPTLVGFPIYEDESMPAVAANNHPIIFGDMGGYLIAERVGMGVSRVEDTTTAGTNTVALFARRRLGGGVLQPWRFQVQKIST